MSARLPIAVLVWITAVVAAIALSSSVAGSIHSSSATASASSDPGSATATSTGSMFQPASFGQALSVLRTHLGAGAKLDNLALYPGHLSVVAVKGSGEVNAASYVGGRYIELSTDGAPAAGSLLPLSRIRPSAPAVVAARITAAAHVPASQLHYMVAEIDPVSHRLTWLVYTVPGSRVEYFSVPDGRGHVQELLAGGASGLRPIGR